MGDGLGLGRRFHQALRRERRRGALGDNGGEDAQEGVDQLT